MKNENLSRGTRGIKKIIMFSMIILFGSLFLFNNFLAQAVSSTDFRINAKQQLEAATGVKGANFGTPEDPRLIAAYIIEIILGFIGIIFVIYLTYGAYLWMTSAGNEEKVKKGISMVRNAAVGTLIVLSAYSITVFAAKYLTVRGDPQTGTFYANQEWEIEQGNGNLFNQDPMRTENDYPAWGTDNGSSNLFEASPPAW
ncbi:MAG TPA: hypothetical protein DEB09_04535 [Candidatus Magasanikbacteria bacterium]|nr:hypothetical protein [Candidatus Magasanikbacteria bacterium]